MSLTHLSDYNEARERHGAAEALREILRRARCDVWGEDDLIRWSQEMPDAVVSLDAPLTDVEAASLLLGWTTIRRSTFELWIEHPLGARWMLLSSGVTGADGIATVSGTAEVVSG